MVGRSRFFANSLAIREDENKLSSDNFLQNFIDKQTISSIFNIHTFILFLL